MSKEVILSVFFEGTSSPINHFETQVAQFADMTKATDITDENAPIHPKEKNFKMKFDGCGVAFGTRGALFGYGLDIQAKKVVQRVNELLNAGKKVKLNVLGLSRGAIGGIYLAQMLKHIDPIHLETNLVLFDPVPGNLISLRKLDFLRITNANKAMDLRDSNNLGSVLGLYPYEPLPAVVFHAPIIPLYPEYSEVKQIVIPGQHQGALQPIRHMQTNGSSALSFYHISQQLLAKGTTLNLPANLAMKDSQAIRYMQDYRHPQSTVRYTHNRHGIGGVKIRYTPEGAYLNQAHYNMLHGNPAELAHVTPTFRMGFQPPLPWKDRKEIQTPEISTLLEYAKKIKSHFSKQSIDTLKGTLMQRIIEKLSGVEGSLSKKKATYVLRDILALTLQRDRNPNSFFSRTGSGGWALKLINSKEFLSLRHHIKPSRGRVTYADLRRFVLGADKSSYFDAAHKQSTYDIIGGKDQHSTTYEIKDRYSEYRCQMR